MNLLLILLILAAVWRGWREARRGLSSRSSYTMKVI